MPPCMKETFRKRVGNYYLGRTLGEVRLPAPCPVGTFLPCCIHVWPVRR